MDVNVIIIAATAIVGSGGAAWAGVRASLDGTRQRITRIENQVDSLNDKVDRVTDAVARLETFNLHLGT